MSSKGRAAKQSKLLLEADLQSTDSFLPTIKYCPRQPSKTYWNSLYFFYSREDSKKITLHLMFLCQLSLQSTQMPLLLPPEINSGLANTLQSDKWSQLNQLNYLGWEVFSQVPLNIFRSLSVAVNWYFAFLSDTWTVKNSSGIFSLPWVIL